MPQFPSSTSASDIWSLTDVSRAIQGQNWPVMSAYESIATTTVGAGGTSAITFSSIPSGYKHLQISYVAKNSGTTENFIQMKWVYNSDTAANYSNHYIYANGSVTGSAASTSVTSAGGDGLIGIIFDNATTVPNMFSVGVLDILDYADTNKYKTSKLLFGADLNSLGRISLLSSNWRNTSAINNIALSCATGNFIQYSHFALYGIKG